MAKKRQAVKLTAEETRLAAGLGFPDLDKIDWDKVVEIVRLILSLIAVKGDGMMAAAKAGHESHCAGCLEAAEFALQAAETSLDCAQGMCDTGAG